MTPTDETVYSLESTHSFIYTLLYGSRTIKLRQLACTVHTREHFLVLLREISRSHVSYQSTCTRFDQIYIFQDEISTNLPIPGANQRIHLHSHLRGTHDVLYLHTSLHTDKTRNWGDLAHSFFAQQNQPKMCDILDTIAHVRVRTPFIYLHCVMVDLRNVFISDPTSLQQRHYAIPFPQNGAPHVILVHRVPLIKCVNKARQKQTFRWDSLVAIAVATSLRTRLPTAQIRAQEKYSIIRSTAIPVDQRTNTVLDFHASTSNDHAGCNTTTLIMNHFMCYQAVILYECPCKSYKIGGKIHMLKQPHSDGLVLHFSRVNPSSHSFFSEIVKEGHPGAAHVLNIKTSDVVPIASHQISCSFLMFWLDQTWFNFTVFHTNAFIRCYVSNSHLKHVRHMLFIIARNSCPWSQTPHQSCQRIDKALIFLAFDWLLIESASRIVWVQPSRSSRINPFQIQQESTHPDQQLVFRAYFAYTTSHEPKAAVTRCLFDSVWATN